MHSSTSVIFSRHDHLQMTYFILPGLSRLVYKCIPQCLYNLAYLCCKIKLSDTLKFVIYMNIVTYRLHNDDPEIRSYIHTDMNHCCCGTSHYFHKVLSYIHLYLQLQGKHCQWYYDAKFEANKIITRKTLLPV